MITLNTKQDQKKVLNQVEELAQNPNFIAASIETANKQKLYTYNIKNKDIEIIQTNEDNENSFNNLEDLIKQVKKEYPEHKITLKP